MAARAISKNARRGIEDNTIYCRCGGAIEMRTKFENRKLRHYAICTSCKATARKPRMLK